MYFTDTGKRDEFSIFKRWPKDDCLVELPHQTKGNVGPFLVPCPSGVETISLCYTHVSIQTIFSKPSFKICHRGWGHQTSACRGGANMYIRDFQIILFTFFSEVIQLYNSGYIQMFKEVKGRLDIIKKCSPNLT